MVLLISERDRNQNRSRTTGLVTKENNVEMLNTSRLKLEVNWKPCTKCPLTPVNNYREQIMTHQHQKPCKYDSCSLASIPAALFVMPLSDVNHGMSAPSTLYIIASTNTISTSMLSHQLIINITNNYNKITAEIPYCNAWCCHVQYLHKYLKFTLVSADPRLAG